MFPGIGCASGNFSGTLRGAVEEPGSPPRGRPNLGEERIPRAPALGAWHLELGCGGAGSSNRGSAPRSSLATPCPFQDVFAAKAD